MANDKLKAGLISDLNNSMAKEMEEAFKKYWKSAMGEDSEAPPITNHMRLLFVAIAQGVVQHLTKNAKAFKITVTLTGEPDHSHTFNWGNTPPIGDEGGHTHPATATVEITTA